MFPRLFSRSFSVKATTPLAAPSIPKVTVGAPRRPDAPGVHKRILLTGASGQVGAELTPAFQKIFGVDSVIASDVKHPQQPIDAHFAYCDVLDQDALSRVVLEQRIDVIVHLASILSAIGEQNPQLALKVNVRGGENVLDVALRNNLQVFIPSTIAAFGPTTPSVAEDLTIMRPTTVYGLSKVYLELLGEYYHTKFGLDFRSVRYPGIISYKSLPGGGTTDYAVEMYYEALRKGSYTSFLRADSRLPMMYMDDCVRATTELITADNDLLKQRVYNIAAMSFSGEEQAESIRKHIPDFKFDCAPDFRQDIADSWPEAMDDEAARRDWGWKHEFDLPKMTETMLEALSATEGEA